MAHDLAPYRRIVRNVLVVEDDREACASVAASAEERGCSVRTARTMAEALEHLDPPPDLVVVDVRLPDGDCFPIVERCTTLRPIPLIVAISGLASPEEAFRLSQAGARGYLKKPHSSKELWAKVEELASRPPDLAPSIAASVGHTPLPELRANVREVMIDEALALAEGSRRGSARLLQITRQAIQQALRLRTAKPEPRKAGVEARENEKREGKD